MAEGLVRVLSRLEKETGRSYKPVDFSRRLRIQKSIYLLKQLGYGPVSKYDFNLYVKGPYSPALAREYYRISKEGPEGAEPARIRERSLEVVAEAVKRGLRFLEAATSLHLIAHANPGRGKEEVFRHFGWVKPSLKGKAEEAWEFLRKSRLLPGPT